jgi:hypothetical protein
LPASDEVPAISTPLDVAVLLPTGAVYGVSAERSDACRLRSSVFGYGFAVTKS